jgi:hypothetical protein
MPMADSVLRFHQQHEAPETADGEGDANVLVTVVMPCLNEARTLAACIEQAHAGCRSALAMRNLSGGATGSAISPSYEIIIADNGSTDGSQAIAIEHGAKVVSIEQKGYGAALMGGIAAARGKYVVMGDSDCSYDFGEVPRFLDKLEDGYDLVMGNRFAGGIMPGAMPWHHRYIGNPVLSGIGRLLYCTPCKDWHCGLRAFDREKITSIDLQCTGMDFASEMIICAARHRLQSSELPITLHPDGRNRPPHLNSFRDGWAHLRLILSEAFLLLVLVIVVGCSDSYSVRDVIVEPEFRDLGTVEAGQEIEHPFRIINGTDQPVYIQSIAPSCSCIHLSSANGDPDKPLEPGESVSIIASMKVDGVSDIQKGIVSVSLLSKDETARILGTQFLLKVAEDYTVSPESIDFGMISANEKQTREIELASETKALKFLEVHTSSDELEATIQADRLVSIKVNSVPSPFRQNFEERVYLRTSSKLRPVVAVPVKWQNQWDYVLQPPVVVFTEQSTLRTLKLMTFAPSLITDAQLPDGIAFLNGAFPQDQPNKEHVLKFETAGRTVMDNAKAVITFSMENRLHVVNVPLVSLLVLKEEEL